MPSPWGRRPPIQLRIQTAAAQTAGRAPRYLDCDAPGRCCIFRDSLSDVGRAPTRACRRRASDSPSPETHMSFVSAANRKAIDIGKLSVEMTTAAGSGHPSTALSLAHLVTVLMYHQMRWDPKDPWNPTNDRLVLSEGHAVPIIYAAYADLGGVIGKTREEARPMTRQDAMTLRAIESPIDGHPHPQVGFHF